MKYKLFPLLPDTTANLDMYLTFVRLPRRDVATMINPALELAPSNPITMSGDEAPVAVLCGTVTTPTIDLPIGLAMPGRHEVMAILVPWVRRKGATGAEADKRYMAVSRMWTDSRPMNLVCGALGFPLADGHLWRDETVFEVRPTDPKKNREARIVTAYQKRMLNEVTGLPRFMESLPPGSTPHYDSASVDGEGGQYAHIRSEVMRAPRVDHFQSMWSFFSLPLIGRKVRGLMWLCGEIDWNMERAYVSSNRAFIRAHDDVLPGLKGAVSDDRGLDQAPWGTMRIRTNIRWRAPFIPGGDLGEPDDFEPDTMWSDLELEKARQDTDLIADTAVACIYEEADRISAAHGDGQVSGIRIVNDVLRLLEGYDFGDFQDDTALAERKQAFQAEFAGRDAVGAAAARDEVLDFFVKAQSLPSWADPTLVAVCEKMFTTWGLTATGLLLLSSLPICYLDVEGTAVLGATQRLDLHIYRRIWETSHMVIHSMKPGGMIARDDVEAQLRTPQYDQVPSELSSELKLEAKVPDGIRTMRRVRLLHASVRYLLLTDPDSCSDVSAFDQVLRSHPWDVVRLGMPINHEDQAFALQTFCSCIGLGLIKMKLINPESPRRDEDGFTDMDKLDAWAHSWSVMGSMLGLPDELLPSGWEEATALYERIKRRRASGSYGGQRLTAALIGFLEDLMPFGLQWLVQPVMLYLNGEDDMQTLGVDMGPPKRIVGTLLGHTLEFVGRLVGEAAQRDTVSKLMGAMFLALIQALWEMDRNTYGRETFDLPDELKSSWEVETSAPWRILSPEFIVKMVDALVRVSGLEEVAEQAAEQAEDARKRGMSGTTEGEKRRKIFTPTKKQPPKPSFKKLARLLKRRR